MWLYVTYIRRLLSCTELRDITISPINVPVGRDWQVWRGNVAALGRLHGSRLQLEVRESSTFRTLAAEPSLNAHVAQADVRYEPELAWSAAGSGLTHQDQAGSAASPSWYLAITQC